MFNDALDKLRSYIDGRQRNYKNTFGSHQGQAVLRDLARFCRANVTTFHESDRAHCLAEGRREVWLRIQAHMNLSPDELFRLSTGQD